jgi:hypothetical protein
LNSTRKKSHYINFSTPRYQWDPIHVASDEAKKIRDFPAFKGCVYDLKKLYTIYSWHSLYKRRPKSDKAQERAWEREIMWLLKNGLPENVRNCDEMCWRFYPNETLTWAETASQNVAIDTTGDEKMSITAMATITFERKTLSRDLIVKTKMSTAEIS